MGLFYALVILGPFALVLLLSWSGSSSIESFLNESMILLIIMIFVLFVIASLSLQTNVTDTELRYRLLPLHLRYRTVPLSNIARCEVTKAKSGYGRGIQHTSDGWEYRVSGDRGVRIYREDDDPFLIGSTNPDELATAIRVAKNE